MQFLLGYCSTVIYTLSGKKHFNPVNFPYKCLSVFQHTKVGLLINSDLNEWAYHFLEKTDQVSARNGPVLQNSHDPELFRAEHFSNISLKHKGLSVGELLWYNWQMKIRPSFLKRLSFLSPLSCAALSVSLTFIFNACSFAPIFRQYFFKMHCFFQTGSFSTFLEMNLYFLETPNLNIFVIFPLREIIS